MLTDQSGMKSWLLRRENKTQITYISVPHWVVKVQLGGHRHLSCRGVYAKLALLVTLDDLEVVVVHCRRGKKRSSVQNKW